MKKLLLSIAALAAISTSVFASSMAEVQYGMAGVQGTEEGIAYATKMNNPELWRAQNECKNPVSYFNQKYGSVTFRKDVMMGKQRGGTVNLDMGTICINYKLLIKDQKFTEAYEKFLADGRLSAASGTSPFPFMTFFVNKNFLNNEELSDIIFAIGMGQKNEAIKLMQRNSIDDDYIKKFYAASSIEEKNSIMRKYSDETEFFRNAGKRYDQSGDIINIMRANIKGDKALEASIINKIQENLQR